MAEIIQNSESVTKVGMQKERRHVFNDYTPQTPTRTNRPFRKRKVSTFTIILLLFLLAVISVLYISNIIAVNHLVGEIEEMKTSYTNIENMNEILRSEINRKTSMERITKIATEEMGMIFPKQPPIWFEIDETVLQKTQQE